MTNIGYARVSTLEQSLDLQIDALKKAGCDKIFCDKVSGVKSERVEYSKLLGYIRPGDNLKVWKLDRLGRSLPDLISKVNELKDRDIGFTSITEQIDTTTTTGKLLFNIIGSLAEFEKDLIKERTLAGLQAARARGRTGGRPSTLNSKQIEKMKEMHSDKSIPISDILDTFKISRSTLYRVVGAK